MIPLLKKLEELRNTAFEELESLSSKADFEAFRVKYLGRKGEITSCLRELSSVEPDMRPKVGAAANELKKELTEALESRLNEADVKAKPKSKIDLTLPGRSHFLGKKHPISRTVEDIIDIFYGLGFSVAQGPDVETDYYNFDALNTPDEHPARDINDTFYVEDGICLRTHTSPVQIRTMENKKPPVRIIAPGRCYRKDTPDASHAPNFFQVEGLYVDTNVTFADLKGVINVFARRMFGSDVKVRFRPHFFPFTEPSAEYDFSCMICGGKGCRTCKNTGWVEISGAGMVDPAVFGHVGYDPSIYSGYAFGMGVDRITMLRYRINDIRYLYDNDLRVLTKL
ncbi:MAG: phenylalanine--tRNA ligase subunit alpha [candidate division Zixibacteria bacterium]|nr:phenylalanine--tRNA ligase subunit alpha [candidate division Zixibacteria bacterium]